MKLIHTVMAASLMSAMKAEGAQSGGSPRSALSPDKIAKGQEHAETSNVSAGFSAEGYGKQMAEQYLQAFGKATVTWQEGIIHLLKTCNDVQQEKAMSAALKVVEGADDADQAAANLRKRVSEARRVFRASREDYSKTLKHMEAKGSWHQKVATLPKASTKGRKAGNGAGKTTAPVMDPKRIQAEAQKIIGKDATPAQQAKVVQLVTKAAQSAVKEAQKQAEANAPKQDRHAKPDLGVVVEAIKRMSAADLRKTIDVALFHLSQQSADKALSQAAKDAMKAFDAIDKAAAIAA